MRFAALNPRAAGALASSLLLTALAGCGPSTGTVSGQVTYKGQPVPGAIVMFRPADPATNAVTAVLDADGRYSVVLPVGEVTVSVDNRNLEPRPVLTGGVPAGIPLPPEVRAKLGSGKAAPAPAPDPAVESDDLPARRPSGRYVLIPEKYYMLETTDLKFTVKGGDQSQDLEMKDRRPSLTEGRGSAPKLRPPRAGP
jgi:hypothetical protein